MRKLFGIMAAAALLVVMAAGPALSAAQKVPLVPCADEYFGVCAPNSEPLGGGGFVVFNDTAGPNNLQVTVSLKRVAPETDYWIYYYVDNIGAGFLAGTVTTNAVGNATFHFSAQVSPSGEHGLAVDVTYEDGNDVYLSEGAYAIPMTPRLTFK